MLEEILELSRTNQKILRSPEILFPPEYFELIMRKKGIRELSEKERFILKEYYFYLKNVQYLIDKIKELVEDYLSKKLPIDKSFYQSFMEFINDFRRLYALSEETEKVFRRILS